jgi:hypothetical protein
LIAIFQPLSIYEIDLSYLISRNSLFMLIKAM